ncbi:hypothetical protein [Chroococcidiopsis sp.]|uniref:hypothetical protein n=1 Tax=Chroococcidiopsis sp. TaxID=3088168 RepID=UPI003F3D8B9B
MNGSSHSFTHDIAQEIVDTYNPDNFKAPLIVSHRTGDYSDRSLVDSELAFGTPKFLKKVGDRVKAVFEKISPRFVEWTRNNEILGISPSFYPPDHQSNPTPGRWSLRHIAGLGKSPPAIKGLAALSLTEFFISENGAINLGEFDNSSFDEDAIALDFMVGEGYEVFGRLRDYLIEKEGAETADRIIPSYYLQLLNEPQPKNDYPFELVEQLMMRVSDLETRLNPMLVNQIYSEPISFALPKTPGAAKKKCTKGTACGGSCISASKTCKKKQSPDNKAKTKGLKEKIKSNESAKSSGGRIPSGELRAKSGSDDSTQVLVTEKKKTIEPKRPTREESAKMTDSEREELREELIKYQPEGKLTSKEADFVKSALEGDTSMIASRMASYEADFVNGLIEDSDNDISFYNGMKKYQNSAPKPNIPIYMSDSNEGNYKVGKPFNSYGIYQKFETERKNAKGKVLVVVPNNSSGFKSLASNEQIISDSKYVVDSIKKQGSRTIVTLKEDGKGEKLKANISRTSVTGSGLG